MSSSDEEPDPFRQWRERYLKPHDGWGDDDVEAAFEAGEEAGFDRATEYYQTGGSFK